MLQQRQLALKRQKDLLARRSQPQLLGSGGVVATQHALQQKKTDWGAKFLMDTSIFDLPPAAPAQDPAKTVAAAAGGNVPAGGAAPTAAVGAVAAPGDGAVQPTTGPASALRRPGTGDSTMTTELLAVDPPVATTAAAAAGGTGFRITACGLPASQATGGAPAAAPAGARGSRPHLARPQEEDSPSRRGTDGASAAAGWDLSVQTDDILGPATGQERKHKGRGGLWKPWKSKERHAQVSADEPTQVSSFGDGVEDLQAGIGRSAVDSRAMTPWAAVDASLDGSMDDVLVPLPGVLEEGAAITEESQRKQAMRRPMPQSASPLPGLISDCELDLLGEVPELEVD